VPAKGGKPGVDIDWDDEDEATMVFDKSVEDTARSLLRSAPPPPPPPAAGAPPPPPAPLPAAGTPPPGVRAAAALVSRPVSVPPPSRAPLPPPPKAMPSKPPAFAPMPSFPPAPAPSSYDRGSIAPSSGGKGMLFAIVVLLLAAGAAAVFVLMPKKGSIVVTVSGPGNKPVDTVQVYVDGNKKCDVSPCRAQELPAGTHLVKVTAAGYQPTADQAVKIAAGDEAVQNITLTRASEGTGFRVTGDARGVKLSVDGKEVGPLPQELKDLTPGEHLLHIDGGDRYESVDKHVTVEADQMQTIDPVLKVKKGLATIKLGDNADGAKIVLVSGSERRPLPQLPITVDISVDKPYSIVATKKGFGDFEQHIEFQDGQAERTFVVNLSPNAAASSGESSSSSSVSALPRVSGGGGTAKAIGAAIGATASPPPKAASGGATLNINSIPVCNVLLDGRPMGQTPKVGVSVSPGSHTVIFISPDKGRKSKTVSVEAGKTVTAVVRF
jgi:serine/threonine-protein kinase